MFNSEISTTRFLRDHWQKRPCLFRGAFPGIQPILTAAELAGMACEEEVNARLIMESGVFPHWSVEHSPIEPERFSQLPDSHWTLLVSDVEKHIDAANELLEHFRFIPDWRIDDLMISFAVDGGSVGPHTDAYDVFLLQAQGCRRWAIEDEPVTGRQLISEEIPLKILADFDEDEAWVLEPGDMLYLPPGIPHHGVAQGDCMTYSIGFRAPSIRQIMTEYVEYIAERFDDDHRYEDPGLDLPEHPAEITGDTIERVREILRTNITFDGPGIEHWFGQMVSDTTHADELIEDSTTISSIEELLGTHTVQRSTSSRFLFKRDGDKADLFVGGEHYLTSARFAASVCQSWRLSTANLMESVETDDDRQCLLKLCVTGKLHRAGE